jgi:hypothetical protein
MSVSDNTVYSLWLRRKAQIYQNDWRDYRNRTALILGATSLGTAGLVSMTAPVAAYAAMSCGAAKTAAPFVVIMGVYTGCCLMASSTGLFFGIKYGRQAYDARNMWKSTESELDFVERYVQC